MVQRQKMVPTLAWMILLSLGLKTAVGQNCSDGTSITQYNGTRSVTDGGRKCQKWSEQTPHAHRFNSSEYFPLDGSIKDAENYCRNVDGDPNPWCYTKDPRYRWQYCVERICGFSGTKCGGVKKWLLGHITSVDRNKDGLYDPDRDCLWQIRAPKGRIILLVLTYTNLENHSQCVFDFLEIYEKDVHYGNFCGNSVTRMRSKSNILYVRFHSDGTNNGIGFRLHYITVNESFDGLLGPDLPGIPIWVMPNSNKTELMEQTTKPETRLTTSDDMDTTENGCTKISRSFLWFPLVTVVIRRLTSFLG